MAENHYAVNPYNYVLNNPLIYYDQYGLDTSRVNPQPPKPAPKPSGSSLGGWLAEVVIVGTRAASSSSGVPIIAGFYYAGKAGDKMGPSVANNIGGWTIGIASVLVKLGVNPASLAPPNMRSQIVSPDDPNYIPDAKDLPWEKGKPPGEGWVWKGKGSPESGQGNWVNPETGQKMHPDFDHPDPKGPHWGLQQPNGEKWDIFPNGDVIPNKK